MRDSASEPHKKEINSARQKRGEGRKEGTLDGRARRMQQQRIARARLAHFIKKVLPLSLSKYSTPSGRAKRRRRRRLGWLPAPYCIKRGREGERHRQKQWRRRRRHHVAAYFKTPTKRKRERPPPPPFFRLLERKRGDSQSSVRRQREKESNTPLLLIVLPKTVRGDGEREGG